MKQAVLAASFLFPTFAAGAEPIWLTTTWRSYHEDRHMGYNERNTGIGLEYQINHDWAVVAGEYRNSFAYKSNYYGFSYTPFTRGAWKAGTLVVNVSGYEPTDRNKFTPVAVPLVTWEHGYFGLNAIIIPPVKKDSGIIALQFKVSIW